jgi:hypothetical protein
MIWKRMRRGGGAFRQHLVMRIFAGMQEPDADGGAGK